MTKTFETATENSSRPHTLTDRDLERVVGGLRLDGVKGESNDSKHDPVVDVQS